MKSDLDQLIEILEAEKKSLKRQIKDCISEFDYLLAYYHSEALSELSTRLNNLYLFKDPLYNEKLHWKAIKLRTEKRYFSEIKDKKLRSRMQERWKERIVEEEKKLREQEKKTSHFFADGQEIDDALFKLYNKECNAFQIIFGGDYAEKILLFSLEGNILFIELTFLEIHGDPDFVLDNRIPDPISGAGFNFDSERKAWIYKYDMTNLKAHGQ